MTDFEKKLEDAREACCDPNPENFYSSFAANLIKGRSFDKGAAFVIQELAPVLEALEEIANLMDDVRSGDYKPDSFTTQTTRAALALLREMGAGGDK